MKKLILFIFVFSLIVPQITYAYWWNPFTWFERNLSTTTESVIAVQVDEPIYSTTTEVTEPTETQAPQVVTKTVVQTNTVTKYVDNPALITENVSLRTQVVSLIAQINKLKEQIISQATSTQEIISAPNQGFTAKLTAVEDSSGTPTVSFGTPTCNYEGIGGTVKYPIDIKGGWRSAQLEINNGDEGLRKYQFNPGTKSVLVPINPREKTYKLYLNDQNYDSSGRLPYGTKTYTFDGTLTLPELNCQ